MTDGIEWRWEAYMTDRLKDAIISELFWINDGRDGTVCFNYESDIPLDEILPADLYQELRELVLTRRT